MVIMIAGCDTSNDDDSWIGCKRLSDLLGSSTNPRVGSRSYVNWLSRGFVKVVDVHDYARWWKQEKHALRSADAEAHVFQFKC